MNWLTKLFAPPPAVTKAKPHAPVTPASAPRVYVPPAVAEPLSVFDVNGEERRLGHRIGRGGEGSVYMLADRDDVVVKVLHRSALAHDPARAAQMRDKIQAMAAVGELRDNGRFAWPRLPVFDRDRAWCGFAMKRVDGYTMQTLNQPRLIAERLPGWNREQQVLAALSLIDGMGALHGHGILVGDINPGNFLVDPATAEVRFIDCDSYQVSAAGGNVFLCRVAVPMYLAPELLDADLANRARTVEEELFSLAILLFRLFVLGAHPYNHVAGDDPVANLRAGRTPLAHNGVLFGRGPWKCIWSHLPFRIKNLFVRAFVDGHRNPAARPGLDDWREALAIYGREIDKGYHESALIPAHAKTSGRRGGAPASSNRPPLLFPG